ncbi:LOW QUALITY PROTEIN: potassium transporter 11-like isoform X1 [Populus alba x Populus x berolinensis]|uniref:Potassium transporter 11-like isoform X1 n=1 Tax=Populus alba x Populus x berolinensis TaxID=444605 RepID=A0AAD6RL17_9ROSI|nr:LOW QUALITY PROTEIN: potassium transporter 11-like isoform X1 [Populus alba x Populus x berolinensis]
MVKGHSTRTISSSWNREPFCSIFITLSHAEPTIPNQHRNDEELTTYRNSRSTFHAQSFAAKTKRWLERYAVRRNALLILVLVGSLHGLCIFKNLSKLSKISSSYPREEIIVGLFNFFQPRAGSRCKSQVVAVCLYWWVCLVMQHLWTDKVGWLFAPIVLLWFLLNWGVLKAFSPVYIYRYLKKGGRDGWTSLGGILLSITGVIEALFADLGPFSAVKIAFLHTAYSGQAAYPYEKQGTRGLNAFYRILYQMLIHTSFFADSIYWPVFIVATAAAVVASQATISATFSIIKQALALGCFPRVKVVHTSKKFLGQIYIPDMNWILMILCICVTAGFQNQSQIGNAYGTAVVIVMLVTTLLMILVMLLVWRCHWILVMLFTGLSLLVECTYFSAVLFKIDQGGWVPLVIAAAFLVIMYVWHYGTLKRYEFEMHSKVSMAWIVGLGPSLGLVRVPGIGLVYTELASGVPHIFSHFITNLPAIHSVVVFVCVKYLPVYTVPEEERFLVKRIGPKNFHMFRCVARYGYKDLHKKDEDFETKLFDSLFLFVRLESMMEGCSDSDEYSLYGQQTERSREALINNNGNITSSLADPTISSIDSIVQIKSPSHVNFTVRSSGQTSGQTEVDEREFLNNCRDAGVVHIMGNTVVRARRDSRFYKKIAVDYIYAFLRKICRENSVIFNVPHESLLNVGQIFYLQGKAKADAVNLRTRQAFMERKEKENKRKLRYKHEEQTVTVLDLGVGVSVRTV